MPWLLCDLMPVGKRVIRGSRDNPDAFWTFCPLKKFPRDKIKIIKCRKCPHFKGYRLAFTNQILRELPKYPPHQLYSSHTQSQKPPLKIRQGKNKKPIQKQREKGRRIITEEMLEEAVRRKQQSDRDWNQTELEMRLKERGEI
jgi:hypothetical protein